MKSILTLKPKMYSRTGEKIPYGSGDAFWYDVQGMPHGQTAEIFDQGGGNPERHEWKFRRTKSGIENESLEYSSAQDALAALQREIDSEN